MPASTPPPKLQHPLTAAQVLDRDFLQHRAKLLDLAAFLDRAQRADGYDPHDFRLRALRDAAALLTDEKPHRTRRILDALSDPTTAPLDTPPNTPACGAPPSPQ